MCGHFLRHHLQILAILDVLYVQWDGSNFQPSRTLGGSGRLTVVCIVLLTIEYGVIVHERSMLNHG